MNLVEIQKLVQSSFEQKTAQHLQELQSEYSTDLLEMITYQLSSGGKRLRAVATIAAAQNWSQQKKLAEISVDSVWPLALAIEVLHNATLIHDDIQDEDLQRRGMPTLWKKYSIAQAINVGDFLLYLPFDFVHSLSVSSEQKLTLQKLLVDSTKKVINGQCLEFVLKQSFLNEKLTVTDYENMVRGKTVALFSLPIKAGAVCAGANLNELQALDAAIETLGIAFQMNDDCLDIWGKKGREKPARDIAEGKISFPLIVLLEAMVEKKQSTKLVKSIIAKPREKTSEVEIEKILHLFEQHDVQKKCQIIVQEKKQTLKVIPEWDLFFKEFQKLF